MCGGGKGEASPSDLEMEAELHGEEGEEVRKFCTVLLELAAFDDLSGFLREIEMGSSLDEVGFWYCKSFGSNKMGFEERTPLMIASFYGSTSILRYLVESGKVDVNRASASDGATALHCAAAGGSWSSLEVVKILIDAAGDVSALDFKGRRAGNLIPPRVKKSFNSLKWKKLEMLLNGVAGDCEFDEEEEEIAIQKKKEYPFDVSLPDINNGIYGTDEFRMYSFKVKPCSRAYSHDWTECPFVHPGENARRRDLRKYHYSCVPCPEFKKGACGKGDNCEYAHGVFESWLHPAQYRTRLCKDEIGCSRKVCFFAHKPEELRQSYASTGMDLSPLSLGSPCSSPVGGGSLWQSKINPAPPALQLPGSRLKVALSPRAADLDMNVLGFEEMANVSSPYSRMGAGGDLQQSNLEDVFGAYDHPSLISQMQGQSPKFSSNSASQLQSPTYRQNMNHLRSSFPSSISSAQLGIHGFDSSPAMAAAILHSRSLAFTKRSQSFIHHGRAPLSSSANSPTLRPSIPSEWGSPNGKLDWRFNGDDDNKLRKSSSFGIRSENRFQTGNIDEPELHW